MSKISKLWSKPLRKWTILVIGAVAIVGFFGYRYLKARRSALPDGIVSGNGRIESKEVDVASKLPLKVKEVLVQEGDLVKPGQVLVRMDTITLESELAEAKQSVSAAREQRAVAKAGMARQTSEIELAKIELERARRLVQERAASQRELDTRAARVKTTSAGYDEELAKLQVAEEQVKVGEANVATIQSRINDATLVSPVTGRVLYRLAEPGEVLGAGGKALTLINLEDVYMEIYLPSKEAGAVKLNSEARFKVDADPDRVAAGYVSFVSPEAQFSPKEVETRTEREKLMFRVKIQVPKELVTRYIARIKTGVRGVGYVKVKDSAKWPAWLDRNVVAPSTPETKPEQPGVPVSSNPSPATEIE